MDRVPELESTSEAREFPETVEEEPERVEPRSDASGAQEGAQRPWWWRVSRDMGEIYRRYTGDIPGVYWVFTGCLPCVYRVFAGYLPEKLAMALVQRAQLS